MNCVIIWTNVLFFNKVETFSKYFEWCNFIIFHIQTYSIFKNIPHYTLFQIPKYGTRFCDNVKKCFVLLILYYDGVVFGIFLMAIFPNTPYLKIFHITKCSVFQNLEYQLRDQLNKCFLFSLTWRINLGNIVIHV